MEVKNIIVYFPWGAGGNFVQNVLSLAPGFQLLSETGEGVDDKKSFLLDYYSKDITPETWLRREWSTRIFFSNMYCENDVPTYWNPDFSLVYTVHGEIRNMELLQTDRYLMHWDRYRISSGEVADISSPCSTHDFTHVFMIPKDVALISNVYISKNPTLNQFSDIEDLQARYADAHVVNNTQTSNLTDLRQYLLENGKQVYDLIPDLLLTDDGYTVILTLIKQLQLDIDGELVKQLHALWLSSTRECFKKIHNRELN